VWPGGFGGCGFGFQSVKSDITGVFDVFWVRALAMVARVAPGGQACASPGVPGDAMPQSACSAGKRSRSATSSTSGGACGTQTQRSIQSLGHALSPSGLDGGSPASAASVAGFGKTGLLAANGSGTFPAFIFKNALAANIRKGSRLKVSGFRWQAANAQLFAQAREA